MNRLEAEPLKSLNVFRNFLIADNFCTSHFNKCAWPQPYVKQCRTKAVTYSQFALAQKLFLLEVSKHCTSRSHRDFTCAWLHFSSLFWQPTGGQVEGDQWSRAFPSRFFRKQSGHETRRPVDCSPRADKFSQFSTPNIKRCNTKWLPFLSKDEAWLTHCCAACALLKMSGIQTLAAAEYCMWATSLISFCLPFLSNTYSWYIFVFFFFFNVHTHNNHCLFQHVMCCRGAENREADKGW